MLAELLKGDYWGDGTTFRPERFLDGEGRVRRDDHLIPFSIGKRQCLGETLAKVKLYMSDISYSAYITYLQYNLC